MEDINTEVVHYFPPFLRVYKDGKVERLINTEFIPPFLDPKSGVTSKDVLILPEIGVSARLFLPKITHPNQKFPLLVYYHGGAFCIESAFSPLYTNYLNSVAAEANVIIVSVEYRLAPEYPLPIAYEDSWGALKWVVSHCTGQGSEPWLNTHADFDRVYLAGDSAGANITHNMAIRTGIDEQLSSSGFKISGVALIHPYFSKRGSIGNTERMDKGDKLWAYLCPSTTGDDDPLVNPTTEPNLSKLGSDKVLIFVAEKDGLKDRGKFYHETLGKSEWKGELEILESKGEYHVFHLFNPTSQNSVIMMKRLVSFLNQDKILKKVLGFSFL